MKPNHKCDPARMALLYIRQHFICTTFKFDAYIYVKANQTKREELNSISNKIYLFVTAPCANVFLKFLINSVTVVLTAIKSAIGSATNIAKI